MRIRETARTLLVAGVVGLVVSAAHIQTAAGQTKETGIKKTGTKQAGTEKTKTEPQCKVKKPQSKAKKVKFEGGYGQPTRLQADVFALVARPEQITELDLHAIGKGTPGVEELLKRLGAMGEARLVGRCDTVVDLTRRVEIESSGRIPVFSPSKGKSRRSYRVSNKAIGCIIDLSGEWETDADPARAETQISIETCHILGAVDEPSSDLKQPVIVCTGFNKKVKLESGRVTLLAGRETKRKPEGQDDDKAVMAITRLKVTRLVLEHEAATQPGQQAVSVAAKPLTPTEIVDTAGRRYVGQKTRFKVDVFQLTGNRQELQGADIKHLVASDATAEQIVKTLGPMGRARILMKSDSVFDLPTGNKLVEGVKVPVAGKPVRKGKSPPRVTTQYEFSGVRTEMKGRWLDAEGLQHADVDIEMNIDEVVDIRLEISAPRPGPPSVQVPCHDKWRLKQRLRMYNDCPLVLSCRDSLGSAESDETTLHIVRLKATRVQAEGDDAEPSRGQTITEVLSDQSQDTHVRIDAYELSCTPDQLSRFDLDRLVNQQTRVEDVATQLSRLSPARPLFSINQRMDLGTFSRMSKEREVPMIRDVYRVPSFTKEDVGSLFGLMGRWRDDQPLRADLYFSFACAYPRETDRLVTKGITLPATTNIDTTQHLSLVSGEPVILTYSDYPVPRADGWESKIIVIRLVLERLGR